jgi:leucine dehydrogenase
MRAGDAVADALRLSRGHELQERDGGPAARRRQGGDPRRRGSAPRRPRCSPPSAAPSRASAALRHRRGRRHERRRHGRDLEETRFVAGLPVAQGAVGGDPGPHTSYGVYLGRARRVRRKLGKDSLSGLHIAIQGAGSVASGLARRAAAEGARISVADIDRGRAQALAEAVGGEVVDPTGIMTLDADVLSPTRSARSSPKNRSRR